MNQSDFFKLAKYAAAREDALGGNSPEDLEKISSVVTGLLGAAASGLGSAYGGGDVLPAALGGYLSGSQYGMGGVASSLGSQIAINKLQGAGGVESLKGVGKTLLGPYGSILGGEAAGKGPLGRGMKSLSQDPNTQNLMASGLRFGAPIAAGKLTDWMMRNAGSGEED